MADIDTDVPLEDPPEATHAIDCIIKAAICMPASVVPRTRFFYTFLTKIMHDTPAKLQPLVIERFLYFWQAMTYGVYLNFAEISGNDSSATFQQLWTDQTSHMANDLLSRYGSPPSV